MDTPIYPGCFHFLIVADPELWCCRSPPDLATFSHLGTCLAPKAPPFKWKVLNISDL